MKFVSKLWRIQHISVPIRINSWVTVLERWEAYMQIVIPNNLRKHVIERKRHFVRKLAYMTHTFLCSPDNTSTPSHWEEYLSGFSQFDLKETRHCMNKSVFIYCLRKGRWQANREMSSSFFRTLDSCKSSLTLQLLLLSFEEEEPCLNWEESLHIS